MRILIIEDEKRLAATVADLLRKAGYGRKRADWPGAGEKRRLRCPYSGCDASWHGRLHGVPAAAGSGETDSGADADGPVGTGRPDMRAGRRGGLLSVQAL